MIKTPWNRVLDLTWGWYQFVEDEESREEEPLTDERLPSQALFDLYQSLGAQTFEEINDGTLSPGGEAEIRAFLTERILPLLLGRSAE